MKYGFITFRSVTGAQRGERVMQRAGVDCTLQRTPKWMAERGCSYCLRLRQRDLEMAETLLRGANVPVSKVYGQWEEEWR